MADESTADDGAMFAFWAFVLRRRRADPEYGRRLDDADELRAALDDFANDGGV